MDASESVPLLGSEAGQQEQPAQPTAPAAPPPEPLSPEDERYLGHYKQLRGIIAGELPISLHLDFMFSANHADLQILKNMKAAVEVRSSRYKAFWGASSVHAAAKDFGHGTLSQERARVLCLHQHTNKSSASKGCCRQIDCPCRHPCAHTQSAAPVCHSATIIARRADAQLSLFEFSPAQNRNSVCHSAIIFANALMHKGTTVDAFLRENLEWLSRATNWAKFSATAGLGVIHSGHLSQVCADLSCALNSAAACALCSTRQSDMPVAGQSSSSVLSITKALRPIPIECMFTTGAQL